MKRRLFALNVALLALVGLAGWRLRQSWLDARAREQRMFGTAFKPAPAPLLPPFPAMPALTPGAYLEVAEQVLFSRDRNPVVVVEAAPVKPMPALPLFYGLMDLGEGPTIILSEKAGAQHRGYHLGEKIGEFTIVAVDNAEIEFEWDGKPVRRKFEELVDKSGKDAAASGQLPPAAPKPPPSAAQATTTNLVPAASSSVISATGKKGPAPGRDGAVRGCQDGDDSEPGTVVDGYRKLVSNSPFGRICRWEPVK